jgi:hypothetical protein
MWELPQASQSAAPSWVRSLTFIHSKSIVIIPTRGRARGDGGTWASLWVLFILSSDGRARVNQSPSRQVCAAAWPLVQRPKESRSIKPNQGRSNPEATASRPSPFRYFPPAARLIFLPFMSLPTCLPPPRAHPESRELQGKFKTQIKADQAKSR